MTWNLWWRFGSWEQRQQAIIDTIGSSGADVVCLQEVWVDATATTLRRSSPGNSTSTPCGRFPSDAAESASPTRLLSRWPIDPIADEALPRRDGTPGHRRVIAGAVGSPWGRWPVASTHLDHRFDDSATRERQARRLLELADAVARRSDDRSSGRHRCRPERGPRQRRGPVADRSARRWRTNRDVRCMGTGRRRAGMDLASRESPHRRQRVAEPSPRLCPGVVAAPQARSETPWRHGSSAPNPWTSTATRCGRVTMRASSSTCSHPPETASRATSADVELDRRHPWKCPLEECPHQFDHGQASPVRPVETGAQQPGDRRGRSSSRSA